MRKNKLMSHLKKVVSNMDSRPLLKCVNYNENGSIYATDSHVMIKISDFHEHKNEFNLNLTTMELVDGQFPDAERLMKMEKIQTEVNVDIDLLTKALKPFVAPSIRTNSVDLTIKDSLLMIKSKILGGFKIEIPLHDCEGEIEISCQPQYLINGLQFIKDAKASSKKMNNGLALIQFNNPVRPFKINMDDEFEYLITPVRNN